MTGSSPSRNTAYRTLAAGGFTLVEMAVAIFIIALLLGSILVPLQSQVESRKYDDTQRILEQAREALLGYVSAYGYFPCPASATSNGQEATGTNHTTGACPALVTGTNTYAGFLPAATLGFTPTDAQGYAVDGWGLTQNRIRYAVSNQTLAGVTNPFTRTNGMRNATMLYIASPQNPVGTAVNLLHVCNSGTGVSAANCNTAVTLASNVPVVIWSLGPNAATGGTTTDELENLDNDRIFVSRTKSDVAATAFDDIVVWISAPVAFNRMIAAGQLP